MGKNKNQTGNRNPDRKLRDEAEGKLAQSPGASQEKKGQTPDQILHELQVHQIELEMQNEELRKAQLALEESRQRYSDLYDFAPVGYFTFTPEALIKEVNLTGVTLLGMARQKLINRRFRSFIAPSDFDLWDRHFLKVLQQGEKQTCDLMLKRQDGSTFYADLESILMKVNPGSSEVHTAVTDVTERKGAEEALRQSEEKYRSIVEQSIMGIGISKGSQVIFANNALLKLFNYDDLEEFKKTSLLDHVAPSSKKLITDRMKMVAEGKIPPQEFEYDIICKGGLIRTLHASSAHFSLGEEGYTQTTFQDITERKQLEEIMRQSEERYRTVIEEIDEGYYEADLAGNYTFVNDSIIRQFQYSREELIGMNYRTYIPRDELERVYQTFNKAYQTGEIIKWFPMTNIRKDGTPIFLEDSVSCLRDKEGRIIGFRGISRDITERKRADEKLNQTLENLRKAIGGIIQVVSGTVETRDPYTAGHQRRVADLAQAIATEMGLADDQREGLRMAGTIHDLGKISVPAEILSKPTKLKNIEYKIIQAHSQIGYDILKGIEFPWPIADMVLQHHERMNGSGYPQGLKGEAISLEARILMVADVVEAMASYRPYRPALGVDAALEEIEKNKGILYDPEVAEGCLKLFREKGFRFV